MTEPLLIGVREAAQILGIGRDSTYRLVREGEIPSILIGRRRYIPRAELRRWAHVPGLQIEFDGPTLHRATRPA